jgi:hypothetical protein
MPKRITGLFYKSEMWTHNLGIHGCRSDREYMYTRAEETLMHGCDEVGSIFLKHVREEEMKENLFTYEYIGNCLG